jgi:DNA repair protein RecO (recombination protein O)
MNYYKTNGIVLKKVDYGDSSLILTVFSRDFGRIALTAKGVKRALSKFESPPEILTVQQFVFSRRGFGPMANASESALLEEFRGLRSDLGRFYAACYAAEVLLGLCAEWQPLPEVYDIAIAALRDINLAEPVAALFRFEAAALGLLGHAPVLDRCAHCGAARKKAQRVALSAEKGGYLCSECAGLDASALEIQGGTAAAMELLFGGPGEKYRTLSPGPKARLDLQRAFDYLLGFLREKPSRIMPLLATRLSGS